ncbi:MAG: hypothetical protein LBI20_04265 [Holosporales bacterium]|jgi:hypothetical protein|nr:hypothetical protein [Holosporales bacterium]
MINKFRSFPKALFVLVLGLLSSDQSFATSDGCFPRIPRSIPDDSPQERTPLSRSVFDLKIEQARERQADIAGIIDLFTPPIVAGENPYSHPIEFWLLKDEALAKRFPTDQEESIWLSYAALIQMHFERCGPRSIWGVKQVIFQNYCLSEDPGRHPFELLKKLGEDRWRMHPVNVARRESLELPPEERQHESPTLLDEYAMAGLGEIWYNLDG